MPIRPDMGQVTDANAASPALRLKNLRPFPTVALRAAQLLQDPFVDLSTVARCVAVDPTLSGELLRRANAADQPRYCEVRDIAQATVALGTERSREIILSSALRRYAGAGLTDPAMLPCWTHSVATALIASELARLCGLPRLEGYTTGLMHDIGRFALLNGAQPQFEQLMANRSLSSKELLERERELFGFDHTEAGEWVARRWNLPASIVESIREHHTTPAGWGNAVALTHTACRLADAMGFSVHLPPEPEPIEEAAGLLPARVREKLLADLPRLTQAITEEITLSTEGPPPRKQEVAEAAPADPESGDATEPAAGGARASFRIWATLAAALAGAALMAVLLLRGW